MSYYEYEPGMTPIFGTLDYYRHIHYLTKKTEIPAGIFLGPFLFLGPSKHPRLLRPLSKFAFWILRFLGWEIISSIEEVPK